MFPVNFYRVNVPGINRRFALNTRPDPVTGKNISLPVEICKPLFFLLLFPLCLSLMGCGATTALTPKASDNTLSASSYPTATFGLYDVSTFDVFEDSNTVHLILGGKPSAQDKSIKLRYTRSDDGGNSWLKPVSLENLPYSITSRGNDVQIAAKDSHLLAVWQTSGELPGMGSMVSAFSIDNGQTWKLGTNPAANNAGDQSHFDIVADRHDHFHVAWLEDPEENGYQSLHYAKSEDNGIHWGKAQTLDGSTCSCCWNTLKLSPDNRLQLLYRDMKPRDMALIETVDDGFTWNRLSTVGEFGWQFDGCPHDGGSLAYVTGNHPYRIASLVWTGLENKQGLYFLSSDDYGKTWSTPQKLGNAAIHGDLAASDGKIMAIWDEMDAKGSSLFYATPGLGGTFQAPPKRLTTGDKAATHPRIVATQNGFLALWTEKPGKQPGRLAWQILK